MRPIPTPSYRKKRDPYILSLFILTSIAAIVFLRYAQDFFIPIAVAIIFASALTPICGFLSNFCKMPRPISAFLVLILVWVIGIGMTILIQHQAQEVLEDLPKYAYRIKKSVDSNLNSRKKSGLSNITKTVQTLSTPANSAITNSVAAQETTFNIRAWLMNSSTQVILLILQLVLVSSLVFFFLTSGTQIKQHFIKSFGTTLKKRRVTHFTINSASQQIQYSLLIMLLTNVLLSVLTWAFLSLMDIKYAAFWGMITGILHLFPYIGTVIVTVLLAIVSYGQSESLSLSLLVIFGFLIITLIVGIFLTTWIQSRYSKMNPAILFVGIVFFGWLWGLWGLLLAPPLLAMIKGILDTQPNYSSAAHFIRGGV